MELRQSLESADKLLAFLSGVCKFSGLAFLTVFAVAAVTHPAWARQKLQDAGLSIKEVNIFGVKLAAEETFNMARALADARLNLDTIKSQLSLGTGSEPLTKALVELDRIQASLTKQSTTLRDVQEKSGLAVPQIPETGWLYVGRLAEDGSLAIGPRLDLAGTKVDGGEVTRVQLRIDTPVVENGEECTRKTLEELNPPTPEELQSVQVLLSPNSSHSLEVIGTATCPSIGKGKWLYAKIRIPKNDVKFSKFETQLRR
ncbi:hypothetical protein BH11PSE9_BH11PSE9_18300 [soil metagenome]